MKEEIEELLDNATIHLRSIGCMNRDFYAGKCAGFDEVLDLERRYK